mgnify:CR=1 FL=1
MQGVIPWTAQRIQNLQQYLTEERFIKITGDWPRAMRLQDASEFLKVALLYADAEEVSEALYLAGTALERMGDADKARAQYRELVQKYPATAAATRARGRLGELGE